MDTERDIIEPLFRKNKRSEDKIRAWLGLLDASGLAVVIDVDGQAVTANPKAREYLSKCGSQTVSAVEAAEILEASGIVPVMAEAGICVWKQRWQADAHTGFDSLTKREREIADWLRKGASAKDIGESAGISPRTVEKHTQNIFSKCEVCSHDEFIRKITHGSI